MLTNPQPNPHLYPRLSTPSITETILTRKRSGNRRRGVVKNTDYDKYTLHTEVLYPETVALKNFTLPRLLHPLHLCPRSWST